MNHLGVNAEGNEPDTPLSSPSGVQLQETNQVQGEITEGQGNDRSEDQGKEPPPEGNNGNAEHSDLVDPALQDLYKIITKPK